MGLGLNNETTKEDIQFPCEVYISDYMIENYPTKYNDLKERGCTFTKEKINNAPLYLTNKHDLEAVRTLLYY